MGMVTLREKGVTSRILYWAASPHAAAEWWLSAQQTDLTAVNVRTASDPSSRPQSDCLYPPNGNAGSSKSWALTQKRRAQPKNRAPERGARFCRCGDQWWTVVSTWGTETWGWLMVLTQPKPGSLTA